MTTIIVTGGAGFCDKARIFEALNANHESSTVTRVLVGDSSKAEKIAADWAKANGIPCAVFMLDFGMDRREAVSQRHRLRKYLPVCLRPGACLSAAFRGQP